MKFKLDENLGTRTGNLFLAQGYQVETVRGEGLGGRPDQDLYEACCAEGRCLVSLDLDFSDVTRFPPGPTGGIVVMRVPRNPTLALLENMVKQFFRMLSQGSVQKQLWIIEPGRIRVHQSGEPAGWDT